MLRVANTRCEFQLHIAINKKLVAHLLHLVGVYLALYVFKLLSLCFYPTVTYHQSVILSISLLSLGQNVPLSPVCLTLCVLVCSSLFAYRELQLHIASCNCMSRVATAHRELQLHIASCNCTSRLQLHVARCNCSSRVATARSEFQLHVASFNCTSLVATVRRELQLHVTIFNLVFLFNITSNSFAAC